MWLKNVYYRPVGKQPTQVVGEKFPEKDGGSGALGGLTLTRSLPRFALDLRVTMSWARP